MRRASAPVRARMAREVLDRLVHRGIWPAGSDVSRFVDQAERGAAGAGAESGDRAAGAAEPGGPLAAGDGASGRGPLVVSHGDLHVRHLLVDQDGSVTGVIDWATFAWPTPRWTCRSPTSDSPGKHALTCCPPMAGRSALSRNWRPGPARYPWQLVSWNTQPPKGGLRSCRNAPPDSGGRWQPEARPARPGNRAWGCGPVVPVPCSRALGDLDMKVPDGGVLRGSTAVAG